MPTNKNAQLRYQILDRCFSDFTHRYYIEDLVDKVNEVLNDMYGTDVQLRQIRDDIKYMRDRVTYDAPIRAYPSGDGKKCYYRYEDKDFSIFKNELSVKEVETLRSTIEMLGKYRGVAGNAWLEEVISNLEYRFGVKSNKENVVAFDQNAKLTGIEFLSELIDSAVSHTPLEVSYKSYKGMERNSVVHPYHLKQYNNRWFLFGLEEDAKYGNHITNMALDRIVRFSRRTDIAFVPNTQFDFSTMFDDIVGVTIPKEEVKIERVLLRFDEDRFPYVKSKPIHPSQVVVYENEHTISLMVKHNKELESQIFSFGSQVEVLEPRWLRQRIAEEIEQARKKYSSVKIDRAEGE